MMSDNCLHQVAFTIETIEETVFLVAIFKLMQDVDFSVLRNGVCDILARKTASPQRHSYRSMPMAAECELLQS